MSTSKKKVLVITYSFPPNPAIASVRMRGLAKYLPRFGWDPTFLTVELPGEPDPAFRVIQTQNPGNITERIKKRLRLDPKESLQKQLGVPAQVSHAKKSFTGKITKRIEGWISYPDKNKLWRPIALKAIRDLFEMEHFDALISSHVVAHLIANTAAREYSIPWIADYRDLWTGNHYYPYGKLRKFLDRRLELRTMHKASALVSVSKPLCNSLETLFQGKSVYVIPNGFDPDEMKEAELHDKFSITYTGQMYMGKRDPELLFKVIRDLLDEGKIQENLTINFYGEKVFWVENLIKQYSLEKIAFQHGFVHRALAFQEQRSSQILLSLNWDHPQEEGVYTGKIFEYLVARRPILALGGPEGVVSDLLEETNTGIHVREEPALKQALLNWYEEYQQEGNVSYRGNEFIHNYSHVKMAERFAEVLNEINKSA